MANRPYSLNPSFSRKAFLVFFGVFLSLVLLESALRLGGAAFLALQEHRNRASLKQKGALRILCLGESTTALGGADSYPAQLEKVLNAGGAGLRFSVVNKGVVGILSTYILRDLKDNLDLYRPDIVITMIGINDGAEFFATASPPAAAPGGLWKTLRVVKLMALLRQHLSSKIKKSQPLPAAPPQRFRVEDVFQQAIAKNPQDDHAYTQLGWCYMNQGKPLEAEKFFKKAVALNPRNAEAYRGLGCFAMTVVRPGQEQASYFQKAIEISPRDDRAYYDLAWCYLSQSKPAEAQVLLEKAVELNPGNLNAAIKLGWCYINQGKYPEAREALTRAIRENPAAHELYGEFAILCELAGQSALAQEYYAKADELRMADYNLATHRNYLRIKKVLDERGIRLVCVQYPMRSIKPLKKMFEGREGVLFVDNEKVFKDAVRAAGYGKYFSDMFAGDFGHCTRLGNRLLAENIAETLLREYFRK